MIAKSIHIVLIHGTFAADSEWTKDGSDLSLAIRNYFPDRELRFHSFQWSGKNSHGKRLEAGAALAKEIEKWRKDDPNQNVFLVAHSHGGNVSLYGLNELEPEAVKGLVCLATPFIHVSEYESRFLLTMLRVGLGFSWFLFWLLVLVAVENMFPVSGLFEKLGDFGDFVLGIGIFFFITSTLYGGWVAIGHLLQLARDKGQSLGCSLEIRKSLVPVLALQYQLDEAATLLGIFQVFGRIFRRPWERLFGAVTEFLLDYGLLLFVGFMLILSMPEWLGWDELLTNDLLAKLEFSMLFAWNFLWIMLVVVPIFLIILYFMRTHPGGFGWDDLFLLGGWRTHALVKLPTKIVNGKFESIKFDPGPIYIPLRHSHIYEDSSVHARICRYIEECLSQ